MQIQLVYPFFYFGARANDSATCALANKPDQKLSIAFQNRPFKWLDDEKCFNCGRPGHRAFRLIREQFVDENGEQQTRTKKETLCREQQMHERENRESTRITDQAAIESSEI